MWGTILLGYDGSEYSKEALQRAEKIALQNDSKLIIANVYREMVTKSYSLSMLEEAKNKISEDVDTEIVSARSTDIDDELIEIGKKHGTELIIVGSRGMGEAKALLLGSVSHGVATGAPTDVLIVRSNR